jgi:hypothetical protein
LNNMGVFAKRLGRDFTDGDWLTRDEAAQVIAALSGRPLAQARQVNDIAHRQGWPVDRSQPRAPLYPYAAIKTYRLGERAGRKRAAQPTPVAQRQRRFREQHQTAKSTQLWS